MLNADVSQYSGDAAAPKTSNFNFQDWRWVHPRSPEAAQSPGALVPAPCFPPRGDPAAFTSFSELARPGGRPSEPYQGMADLEESFFQDWRWVHPRKPEAAQSPGALVPAPCFPPRGDPAAFTSFSELARPGGRPSEPYQGMADLEESFFQDWRWVHPRKPEAAQSPGALVPAPCFPPRGDPAAFTSFSELARPGGRPSEPYQGMADLEESFFQDWRWVHPRKPEAAQSPGALVPAPCFPPRGDPAAFTSFSELARPGGRPSEPYQGMADLVESFWALGATPRPLHSEAEQRRNSMRTCVNCNIASSSQTEGALWQPQDGRPWTRRASSCGAPEQGRGSLLSWSGILPPRCTDANPPGGFSLTVFLKGLPLYFTKAGLLYALRDFYPVRAEWPGTMPCGYAYVTLKSEQHVRALLHASRRTGTKWIYRLKSSWVRANNVEVIPWAVTDSNWMSGEDAGKSFKMRLEPSHTVFVGALHGIISASALARIMNDLFSDVLYAGIDIDKNKYPIGSGRVTFGSERSYMRAVSARYVVIRASKITTKIQVDPYLEDSMCSICDLRQGPYFCRVPVCFRYFCRTCWAWQHPSDNHEALMRKSKRVTLGNSNGQPQPAGEMWAGFTQTRERAISRQPSTTEYLPGMLHTGSPVGLLPAFPSWSLVCLGASSLYSHSAGLPEHLQSGFLPHTNYLLPWDCAVRVPGAAAQWRARGRGKATHVHSLTVKIFIGFEYECPRGHRFMMSSPDTVVSGGGGWAGGAGARLAAAPMPLVAPCLCRAHVRAQLARLHVVTPKAAVHVTLDPKVEPVAGGPVFSPLGGSAAPLRLSASAYWVLRFPFVFADERGVLPRARDPAGGTVKPPMFGLQE